MKGGRSIKRVLRKLGRFLPTKLVLYIDYGRSYKKVLNLNNPQYFGEKIQWIKLNGDLERYGKFVDKYEVREYVKEKIGEVYLNKLYGVYASPLEIEFSKLPQMFVIKMTNGTGGNIICKDKKKLDIERVIYKLTKWQREKFYMYTKEMQYKNVECKIICEEYLEDETGNLRDYKFHCVNGNIFMIEIHTDRFMDHKINFYDLHWNDYGCKLKYKKIEYIEKPSNLQNMITIVQMLSKGFPFVRVDLYSVRDKIYFGEFTFTPGNGTLQFYPLEKDIEIAKIINLNGYEKG